MNLKEYLKLWDDYYIDVLTNKVIIPTNPLLLQYYESYQPINDSTQQEIEYIPEPFLGDAEKAKIAIINTNPGGVLQWQNWNTGDVPSKMKTSINNGSTTPYSNWAKDFIYFDTKDDGGDFWNNRLKYINSILNTHMTKEDLFALEIYPWHSKEFYINKLKNIDFIFNEFILKPLSDLKNVKYVFLLRKPAIKAALEAGMHLNLINTNWKSKNLQVYIGKNDGKIFIGTINNFSGYPTSDSDIQLLSEIISKYSH